MMERTNVPEDMPIQAGLVSKAIAGAQQQVEAMNFGARKHVLEYDDVMNKQREVIYAERNRILDGKDIHGRVEEMLGETISDGVLDVLPRGSLLRGVGLGRSGGVVSHDLTGLDSVRSQQQGASSRTRTSSPTCWPSRRLRPTRPRRQQLGDERLRELERQVMLRVIDTRGWSTSWRWTISRRASVCAPWVSAIRIVEYKSEAYEMFGGLVAGINEDFLRTIMHIQVVAQAPPPRTRRPRVSRTRHPQSSRSSPGRWRPQVRQV